MPHQMSARLRDWVKVHGDKLPPEPEVRGNMLISAADELDRLADTVQDAVIALDAWDDSRSSEFWLRHPEYVGDGD